MRLLLWYSMLPIAWALAAPLCAYEQAQPATRRLMQQIDRSLPRVLARFGTPSDSSTYDLPDVDTTQCFVALPVERAFSFNPFQVAARGHVLRHLRRAYFKNMGVGSSVDGPPDSFGATVLEYDNSGAAVAAKLILDSLVATCSGRKAGIERCATIDQYRVSRYGAVLLNYDHYSPDPIQRRNLGSLARQLGPTLEETPRFGPSDSRHAASRP